MFDFMVKTEDLSRKQDKTLHDLMKIERLTDMYCDVFHSETQYLVCSGGSSIQILHCSRHTNTTLWKYLSKCTWLHSTKYHEVIEMWF